MDIVHDQLAPGHKIRVSPIVDTFSRFSPPSICASVIEARMSCRLRSASARQSATPRRLASAEDRSLSPRDLDIWAYQKGILLDSSRPDKPTGNSFIESFNGKFSSECLNTHWLLSLDDARQRLEDWRRDYNEVRPHSVISNNVPISLLKAQRRSSGMSLTPQNASFDWLSFGGTLQSTARFSVQLDKGAASSLLNRRTRKLIDLP